MWSGVRSRHSRPDLWYIDEHTVAVRREGANADRGNCDAVLFRLDFSWNSGNHDPPSAPHWVLPRQLGCECARVSSPPLQPAGGSIYDTAFSL